jgi:hypothetical protein
LQKQNGEEDSLEDEDEDDDFAFSKEAKRADKAAEVFVYQAGSLPQDFIDKNLEDIGIPPPKPAHSWSRIVCSSRSICFPRNAVKEIFAIFDINAEGDFDNFDKMFASLLGPYGSKVFNVFNKNRKLILHLLNYLHDPAIRYSCCLGMPLCVCVCVCVRASLQLMHATWLYSETLMGVIKATLPDQVLMNFYNALNEDGFWETLGQKIYGPGTTPTTTLLVVFSFYPQRR